MWTSLSYLLQIGTTKSYIASFPDHSQQSGWRPGNEVTVYSHVTHLCDLDKFSGVHCLRWVLRRDVGREPVNQRAILQ